MRYCLFYSFWVIAGGATFVSGCRTSPVDLNKTLPSSTQSLQAIREHLRKGMTQQAVVIDVGPPQRRHQWSGYYPAGTKEAELMYWNRQDATHAVIISLANNVVTSIETETYPAWALNPSLLQSHLGKNGAQIRKLFGEPDAKQPESNTVSGPKPNKPGSHWIYGFGAYSRKNAYIDVHFDSAGTVRAISAGPLRMHAL